MSGSTPTASRLPRLVAVLIVIVGLVGAMLLAPGAANANPPHWPTPKPANNGGWDGGPYHITGGFKTVQEMPNHHLFAAGDSVSVTNPVTNAQVTWSPPAGWTNLDVKDSAVQSDGKIIIVGNHGFGRILTRLVYDGSTLVTDPTFSTSVDIPDAELTKVTVLPDDTIVVGGAIYGGVYVGTDFYEISGLVKLTKDGELVTDWRAGGSVDIPTGDFNYVVALDSDPTTGAIYVGGYTNDNYNYLRKYSAAGELDTTFVDNVNSYFTAQSTGFDFNTYTPTALKVLSNQQVLLGVPKETSSSRASFRLYANGTNDPTYVGANLYASYYFRNMLDFAEMSTGKYLISGGVAVQRVNSNGSIDQTWDCGGRPADPVFGCGREQNYPITLQPDGNDPYTFQSIELKNGAVLVAQAQGTFTLLAVGKPKVTDVSAGGRKLLRIDTYANVNGTFVADPYSNYDVGGTKLYGFTIQYNNAARQGAGKPAVIWGRFLKPPTGLDSSITIDLTSNQAVATCQANLVVVGKPRPACFRNAEIDTNLTSPRTYSVFLMFQDNTLNPPQSPFSLYSYGMAANPVTIAP